MEPLCYCHSHGRLKKCGAPRFMSLPRSAPIFMKYLILKTNFIHICVAKKILGPFCIKKDLLLILGVPKK